MNYRHKILKKRAGFFQNEDGKTVGTGIDWLYHGIEQMQDNLVRLKSLLDEGNYSDSFPIGNITFIDEAVRRINGLANYMEEQLKREREEGGGENIADKQQWVSNKYQDGTFGGVMNYRNKITAKLNKKAYEDRKFGSIIVPNFETRVGDYEVTCDVSISNLREGHGPSGEPDDTFLDYDVDNIQITELTNMSNMIDESDNVPLINKIKPAILEYLNDTYLSEGFRNKALQIYVGH